MRRSYLYFLVVLSTSVTLMTACKKSPPATYVPTPSIQPFYNTVPYVYAGQDITILVTDHSCTLRGSASDAENNIEKYLWTRITGAATCLIESPNAKETKVSNLEKGTYAFEFSVTDKGGLNNKDTVAVSVMDPAAPGHGEVLIKDLHWFCPMGCSVLVYCFSCYVPANTPYKVYVAEGNSNQWIEAVPDDKWTANDKYSYGIDKNLLWIYTNYESAETVNVKFTF